MLTMQDALLTLTQYWAGHGCLVVQPVNTEVGAGTLNPATFLRVLGPEPWRVAYVEPSVRPDDARYGENPNRIQTHTQFQVILKPEPGEAQEMYLGSLAALGVDLRAHDVRFVEDNWASPALGAWGLGWEVWLDGLEITQFTYFQQAGGINLDPVSVEITYGMERILMALQAVFHFKEIVYAPGVSYGELFGQAEYEMSRYYLDDADIDANRTLFETYAREAERLLDSRLPVPAYGYVLKCSHAFNVLDARGAVSPTERARSFARMRRLAGRAAKLWLERRAELGHPLGIAEPPPVAEAPPLAEQLDDAPRPLLVEIGVEELPAAEVTRAAEALAGLLRERLAAARLDHGEVRALASPRRVVGLVDAVSARQEDRSVRVRGPRVSAAFAEDGTPTKAAQGFARAQGVGVDALEREDVGGVEHVVAVRQEPGRPAVDVLAELLPGVVPALPAEKNMRWNAPGLSYVRPVRWLVALLGDAVVPFVVSTVASGRTTRLLRTAADQDIDVAHADGYLSTLADHLIVVDPVARRDTIVTRSTELAAAVAGHIPWDDEAELLAEVTNLVEAPVPILGGFDERYLELPDEVLTTVMRKHQRYLPVRSADGRLLPHFVAVANGAVDTDAVRAGNEAVLRARFEDAAFFWRADLAVPLAEFRAGLATLTFEERLGSVADRAARIAGIAAELAEHVDLAPGEWDVLVRAAGLAKFDLGTQMVVELSSLAGVMAREYARRAGEPEPVAEALYEMELPRHSADAVPDSRVGALLSLADRFDLVAGLFAVGAVPTGSSDPFGVRRAALGLVSVLRAFPGLRVATVSRGLEVASRRQPVPVPDATRAEAAQFVVRRYERQVLDAGYEHRLVQAVLPLADAPARADETLAELARHVTAPGFAELVEALQRTARIVPPGTPADYDPTLLTEPAERRLREATMRLVTEIGQGPPRLSGFVAAAAALVDPINTFFDEVLVMAEDPAVRAARLGLLATIDRIAAGVLDWSRL